MNYKNMIRRHKAEDTEQYWITCKLIIQTGIYLPHWIRKTNDRNTEQD